MLLMALQLLKWILDHVRAHFKGTTIRPLTNRRSSGSSSRFDERVEMQSSEQEILLLLRPPEKHDMFVKR